MKELSSKLLALTFMLGIGASQPLLAQSGSWTNDASGNWGGSANWQNAVVADGAGNTAYFSNSISANRSITNDTSRTIGNLEFGRPDIFVNSGARSWTFYRTGANVLTLDNGASVPTITCWKGAASAGTSHRFSAPLSSSLGLIKRGESPLWLNAANPSLNGTLIIADGSVYVQAAGALGSMSVVISNGCYLDFYATSTLNQDVTLNGMGAAQDGNTRSSLQADSVTSGSAGSFTINGTVTLNATSDIGGSSPDQTMTLNGLVTGPGGLVKNGFSNGGGTLVLAHTNNLYAGGTTVPRGNLRAKADGSLGSGDVTVNGGKLQLDTPATMNTNASLFLFGISNVITLNFTGTQSVHQLSINGSSCAPGTWGALGSGASHESAAFYGQGKLAVLTAGPGKVWVARTPAADEKPEHNQFYARDNTGCGTIYYNGTLGGSPDSVFLKVYANGILYTNLSQSLVSGAYRFAARIPAGLITYSVQFGSVSAGTTTVLDSVTNLICGDAYIIQGQSNAQSDAPGADPNPYPTPWIRTYHTNWENAVRYNGSNTVGRVGYWGMDLATNLLLSFQVPICIMNGAVGGSRIDQHQPNPNNHYDTNYTYSIYGNLLNRVASAKLTHGIRAIFWYQGESDCGTNLSGGWRYDSYQQNFLNLAAAWNQDYPNFQNYYVFQVRPDACSYGGTVGSDMLREKIRSLSSLFSNLSLMSTLGIAGDRALCHFYASGYAQVADLMAPLVKRDHYGVIPTQAITAPDVKRAYYTSTNQDEIAVEFGQDMAWNSRATNNFQLDRVPGKIKSGSVTGTTLKLQLTSPSTAQTLDYLVDESPYWDGTSTYLLFGANGIAALTFYNIPIAPPLAAPAVASVSPSSGRTNGGTVVTLTGANFLDGATVQFGNTSAASTVVNSSTQITATTPAHSTGLVNLTVRNPDQQTVTITNAFHFVPPPLPATNTSALLSGNNLTLTWIGGADQTCFLLSSTNAAIPTAAWNVVATNVFFSDGRLTNSIPVQAIEPMRFYQLSMPYN
ncbi:MAG: IPT/TIG domain-containing protein [Verrucomicrobiota bacterium]